MEGTFHRLRSGALTLELARASFPAAMVVLALFGQRGAINLALGTVAVYAIRALALPRPLDRSLLIAAAVLVWGNALSLYSHILYYDLLAHFFVQMLMAPALYFLLLRTTGATMSETPTAQLVFIFALGLAVGALWEIAEWTSDGAFGTHFVKGPADTMTDLIADACGAFLGANRFANRPQEHARLQVELETQG